MALRHYTECFSSWQCPDADTDAQWVSYSLYSHGIPASAVVEIAISSLDSVAEREGGVRATSSSLDRKIDLSKSADGDAFYTTYVQADASGCIEYYAENFTDIRFTIVGYWMGCEYTEKMQVLATTGNGSWEDYALNQHGVTDGQICDITASNIYSFSETEIGVRASGSARELKFEVTDVEGGGEACVSQLILASGDTAAVQLYPEVSARCVFRLLGVFTAPPGEYVETSIDFGRPSEDGTWEKLDVGASGIPVGGVTEFVMGQPLTYSQMVGVRSTDLPRLLDIDESKYNLGEEWATLHAITNASGEIEYYAEDVSELPKFLATNYWTNFTDGGVLSAFGSADLHICGRNLIIHYIENYTLHDIFETASPSTWAVQDVSSKFLPAALVEGVVAEVLICCRSDTTPGWGGARSVGSSLDRRYRIHESEGDYDTNEVVCLHVPVSADGEIEFYAQTASYFELRVMGGWVGARYTETTGTFKAGATDAWTQYNLDTYGVPGGKVAEVLISHSGQTIAQSGGVRQVGSSIDRLIDIASLIDNKGDTWEGSTYFTMFVETSGDNAAIEVYAGNNDEIDFHVVGYWDQPPGEYTELMEVITPDATNDQWKDLDITAYSVPSGSVAEIALGNKHWSENNSVGIKEYGSTLPDRKISWPQTDDDGSAYNGICGGRWQANVVSGNIQTYHDETSANSYFAAIGYWDDITRIPIQTGSPVNLFVCGIEPHNILDEIDYPSGMMMYVEGVPWGSSDLFVSGPGQETASGTLWIHGPEASGASGSLFISAPHLVGTSGVSGAYPTLDVEYGGSSPTLFVSGPTSVTSSGDLFLKTIESKSSGVDLFLKAYDPITRVHYIEDFRTWTPSTKDTWEEKDLSAYMPDVELITAEILIANSNIVSASDYIVGVRTAGSSLDRKCNMVWADVDGGSSTLTLHVQLSDGKIECYAPSGVDFYLMGYWVGAEYVESTGTFTANPQASWLDRDLDTYGVPSGAIAEIAIGAAWGTNSVGVRSVGSSYDRTISSIVGDHSYDREAYWTSFVQTSGANATVQAKTSTYTFDHHFYVVGYWAAPPGDYTDVFDRNAANPTSNGAWEEVSVSGVPSESVASFGLISTAADDSRSLGIRDNSHSLERRITQRSSAYSAREATQCWHTNINSDVQSYSEDATGSNDDFTLLGYWNNFTDMPLDLAASGNLYIGGKESHPGSGDLFVHGHQQLDSSGSYPSGVPLYIYGVQLANIDLFTYGLDTHQASGDLFVHGVFGYATDADDCPDYPSGLQCYTKGSGIIPHNDRFNLFTQGLDSIEASGNLFTHGITFHVASGDLFIKVPEPQTGSMTLFVHNPIDAGPGLIREPNAVFYLKNYHDGRGGSILESVNDQEWYIPTTFFQHSPFIGVSGKTVEHVSTLKLLEPFAPTAGDGTYPHYDDLGGFNYQETMDNDYRTVGGGWQSNKGGYHVNTEHQQNICEAVEDYQYAGSGSFTTVFWMSGAHTSGNVAEAGWFYKGDPDSIGDANARQTIGIKIEGTSGITVITSVRDLPYDQVVLGDLWWGGTTHYGTPTGTSYSWRAASPYYTWTEEWPTVYLAHDPITFVALHADFIASGVDGSHPNHMKVWLSLDGQPWNYIGSGLTGPPASSLSSYDDPNNRYPENCVGIRQQGVNVVGGIVPAEMGGVKQGSIILAENVLWTDADRFGYDELLALHSIVDTYNRPLDEYRPTLVPHSTYIQRTVGTFEYDPTTPEIGYAPSEICSGLRVTIEVGLGDYGADASAYLLEETPPSGFYVGNIQPTTLSAYNSQGTRPLGGQQIFHDPQSGVMQPYNNELNINSYGASIRWVNHDNHPEVNQRRSPTPTGIYTYDLYPIHPASVPRVDDFTFTGSGVFFGGSTGSGLFVVQTTGDTSGTTNGLTGGLVSTGCNLYIQGPLQPTNTVNLYLRTQETFTSAYIGTSPRTPELTDFVFAADGNAAIESMAGIEYGPPLYTRGPRQYEDTCSLVIFGPMADDMTFFIHGYRHIDTSGDYPSGVLLRIGDGHEPFSGSGNLFTIGPKPWSSGLGLYIMAGAFTSVDGGAGHGVSPSLFVHGHDDSSGNCNLFTKGPEFTCTSGTPYPYDADDFTYPYGGPSLSLFTYGHTGATDTCPLYIGPPKSYESWTLYLKTEDNNPNESLNIFIHGFTPASGTSGVNQTFTNIGLYLEAADADYPYTAGGTEEWTLFMKAQDGNLTDDEAWTMFLKADFTTPATCSMYVRGHAPGEAPRGNEISGLVGLVCSVNPDDPTRIGAIPCDADDDPWNLFLKCEPGHFGTATLYMSGAAPILYAASGNLFVEGLFEQETDTALLYLMGVSGMFNNGPSGLALFLDAGTLVYNTSGNLYTHGY